MRSHLDVPVLVDNDVNSMALGEQSHYWPGFEHLMLVKVATGDVWGALQAGTSGFLLKRASPERHIDAVHTLAAGDALLDPGVTRDLVARFVAPAGGPAAAPAGAAPGRPHVA
jgi:DNA-binding NarL/FixJ family response regulator